MQERINPCGVDGIRAQILIDFTVRAILAQHVNRHAQLLGLGRVGVGLRTGVVAARRAHREQRAGARLQALQWRRLLPARAIVTEGTVIERQVTALHDGRHVEGSAVQGDSAQPGMGNGSSR